MTGRICSFAMFGSGRNFYEVIPEISDAAEIELINKTLSLLNGIYEETIVTWNGMEFDFPYIYKRALLLKVEIPEFTPPLTDWMKRYSFHPHCDLMKIFSCWSNNTTGTNLDFIGKRFLGRGKTQRDYLTYVDLIKNGEGDKIGIDCLCDVELTHDLFNIFKGVLF
jgi:DNA polymerase elongation subunit (family B)